MNSHETAHGVSSHRPADGGGDISSDELDRRIAHYRLRVLHENARNGSFAIVVASVSLAALLVNFAATNDVSRWLAAVLAILALRFGLILRYFTRPDKAELSTSSVSSLAPHVVLLFALGVLYGMVPFIFGNQDMALIAFVNLWLAGMCFSLLLSQGILVVTGIAFAIPAMLPLLGLYLFSDNVSLILVGLGNVLLFAFLYVAVGRTRNALLDEVGHRLRYEQLATHYERERAKGDRLIRELSDEVERRRDAEVQLRRARDAAETQSNQDHLTGLANRRVFDKVMAREWFRGMRDQKTLAMILCDIDSFKAYNDLYGMHAGDQCLTRIGATVNDYVKRAGDFAARYGGEEFAVLLPDTDELAAIEIAESMRGAVREQTILHAGSTVDRVITASFGVATMIPEEGSRYNELVQAADNALSHAKRSGGNCVFTIYGAGPSDNQIE